MAKQCMEERRIVSAQVTRADAAQLEALVAQADRSLSAEIRRALREHLARHRHSDEEQQ